MGADVPGSGSRATSSNGTAAQMRAEERERPAPGLLGGVGVVDLGPGVVEEGVVGAGVDEHLHVLAQVLQLLLQGAHRVGVGEVVLLGVVALHGGGQVGVVGLGRRPRDHAVEGGDGLHRVGPLAGEHQGQAAAHAEPDDAHAAASGAVAHVVDGAAHVLGRLLQVERHHLLARLIGLGRGLAVVQIGGQGHEALAGQPVADLLDVVDQAPPLLDHDEAGAVAAGGRREVALSGGAVARKLDDLTHGWKLVRQ